MNQPFRPPATVFALGAAIAVSVVIGCGGDARPYPNKTVTVVCPWAPGGGTDRVSRFWADSLESDFGSPFVVVNKTGGSGVVGHSAGASARPDGYTITMITAELNTMHELGITKLTREDFRPIIQVNADAAAIMVRDDAPWQTLGEFLEDVRQRPGEITMSGTATGGTWDLARVGLLRAAELPADAIVWVPEMGAAPSLVQLLGGHIDAVCCSVPEAAPQIAGGQLRTLAVMADERLAAYADVPTCQEQGVDWSAVGWRGLAVPRDTPDEVVALLYETCRAIAESDAYRDFMDKNGFAITIRGPEEFAAFLEEQDAHWKPVVAASGRAQP